MLREFRLCITLMLAASTGAVPQPHLSAPAQYNKYVDALPQVQDFGTHYYHALL